MTLPVFRYGVLGASLGLALGACALEPGRPSVKVQHGAGTMPGFHELNYAVDFGRRCSPADNDGRHYVSYVWLRANRADGGYDRLRAAPENCDSATVVDSGG